MDTEARHARKTRSRRIDGYKAHIVAEPDTGLITAAELTTADTPDAATGARLLQQDPTAPHNNTHNTDTAQSDTADTDTAQVDPARPPGRPPCLDRPGLRCLRRVEPAALPAAGMGRRASGLRSNVVT